MKKCLLFSMLIGVVMSASAQVSLLHTFGPTAPNESYSFATYDYSTNTSLFFSENSAYLGYRYWHTILNEETGVYLVEQINSDFQVVKTIQYQIPLIDEYEIRTVQLTSIIFDDDPSTVELIVKYGMSQWTNYNDYEKVLVYQYTNQTCTTLADFGTGCNIYVYSYLHVYDNQYRLWVTIQNFDEDHNTYFDYKVYSVNKQNATGLQQISAEEFNRKVFEHNQVVIYSGDKKYNMQGMLIE